MVISVSAENNYFKEILMLKNKKVLYNNDNRKTSKIYFQNIY